MKVLIALQAPPLAVQYSQHSHRCGALPSLGRIIEGDNFGRLRVSHCVPIQCHMAREQRSPSVRHQTL